MRSQLLIVSVLLSVSLTACGQDSSTVVTTVSTTSLPTNPIALHAPGLPDAQILPSGDLKIDGKSTPVSAEQRTAIQKYYVTLSVMREPKAMSPNVASKGAAKIQEHAEVVCEDLANSKADEQRELKNLVPALTPYFSSDTDDTAKCTNNWSSSSATGAG